MNIAAKQMNIFLSLRMKCHFLIANIFNEMQWNLGPFYADGIELYLLFVWSRAMRCILMSYY